MKFTQNLFHFLCTFLQIFVHQLLEFCFLSRCVSGLNLWFFLLLLFRRWFLYFNFLLLWPSWYRSFWFRFFDFNFLWLWPFCFLFFRCRFLLCFWSHFFWAYFSFWWWLSIINPVNIGVKSSWSCRNMDSFFLVFFWLWLLFDCQFDFFNFFLLAFGWWFFADFLFFSFALRCFPGFFHTFAMLFEFTFEVFQDSTLILFFEFLQVLYLCQWINVPEPGFDFVAVKMIPIFSIEMVIIQNVSYSDRILLDFRFAWLATSSSCWSITCLDVLIGWSEVEMVHPARFYQIIIKSNLKHYGNKGH